MSKATVATVKSFMRKNRAKLLLEVESDFDGMSDCVQHNPNADFRPASPSGIPNNEKYDFGISGVWFVGNSRDYVTEFAKDGLRGYHVSNCCGSWTVAIRD